MRFIGELIRKSAFLLAAILGGGLAGYAVAAITSPNEEVLLFSALLCAPVGAALGYYLGWIAMQLFPPP